VLAEQANRVVHGARFRIGKCCRFHAASRCGSSVRLA